MVNNYRKIPNNVKKSIELTLDKNKKISQV